jgi:cysteine desulfurase
VSEPVYLDGFSTLPLAPEAKSAMLAAWEHPGNSASPHAAGERAAQLVEAARVEIADLIGAAAGEIIFTSGATEANNLALVGTVQALWQRAPTRRRIVVSAVEHKAVLEPARALEARGFELVIGPVDAGGRLDLRSLAELVDETTLLVSVMAANNETGVVQPIGEAAAIAHAAGALVHCDAAQAVGKIPINVIELDLDYLSLSGHKMYGPMGIGALYVSASATLPAPLQWGGRQERGVRPGTQPVALIAGLGAAALAARGRLEEDAARAREQAARMVAGLEERQLRFIDITNGHEVLPGSLVLSLEGVVADDLCLALSRTVHLSTGSACTSGQLQISHVFEAMGLSEERARSVVRIFCHRYLRMDELEDAADKIARAAHRSRLATGGRRQ